MPKPDSSLSAVVVSGGKQYRVAPGDHILVDRLAAEPGSPVKLGRVLLLSDQSGVKVGNPGVEGVDVDAKVIAHRRGPRIESIRYKSKKRVRVHRGGRAHLTALEIIAVGGVGLATDTTGVPAPEAREGQEKATPKGRATAAPKKKAAAPKAEVVEQKPEETEEQPAEAKKRAPRRRTKKETE